MWDLRKRKRKMRSADLCGHQLKKVMREVREREERTQVTAVEWDVDVWKKVPE